ncbi:hypothetical protein [Weissella confusa]|uniref:hypothetical protein n=1 Tax=Weissella confusa TaxID=1583 RepID=UPI001FB5587C|nr:hypothetical protein [Weissella confusa]
MEFRTLANGVKMPVLGYGVAQVQGAEATQAIKDAIATGYRMIDTAVIYDNEGYIVAQLLRVVSTVVTYFWGTRHELRGRKGFCFTLIGITRN